MWNYLKTSFLFEQTRWFLWVPVLFATGIGIYFVLPTEPSIWIILTILEVLLLLAWLFRHSPVWLRVIFALLLVAAGFANVELRALYLSRNIIPLGDKKIYLSGRIDKMDSNYSGRPRIVLGEMKDFDGKPIPGNFRLTMIHKNTNLRSGDCVELVGVVSSLFKSSLAGGYQFDRQLFFDGITGTGYTPSDVLPVKCEKPMPRFGDFAAELRGYITRKITAVLPGDEAAVAVAIVAGNQTQISQPLIQAYRDSGLAHFLSISGLHMSMLAGLMFFMVRLIIALIPSLSLRYDSKKAAALLAILISAVYLVISGAAIPAQRAFIMTLVVLLAVLFARQAISMRTLAWSALVVLVVAPQALISASFQMSFAAVTALVAFYEKFAGRINRFMSDEEASLPRKIMRGIFIYFLGVIIADFVASMATLPYAVFHFNRVALYTSLTNVLAGPVIGLVIMPFVLVALLLIPFGLSFVPLKIVGFGLYVVNELTLWVSSLPHAAAGIVSMPLWGLLLITLGGLWLCLWRGHWRCWGWIVIVLGVLSVLTVKTPDMIIDKDIRTVAIKTTDGRYYFLPGANRWNKTSWLSKNAAFEVKGKKVPENELYPSRITVEKKKSIAIDGVPFDMKTTEGASIYLKNGKLNIETVRGYIGRRLWNN